MPRKKESPVVEDYSMYLFELPLTAEEKKIVVDILRKDYEWDDKYSSFQIKTYDEDLDKKIEEENELRKTARFIAEKRLLDVITIAMAISWNRRDDFNAIRKIIRKYTKNEYEYYFERNCEIWRIGKILSRIRLTQNYLRPRIGEKKKKVEINDEVYTIHERRLVELKKAYKDVMELREAILKEAVPYKDTPAEKI